jgi:hypothetical protein
MARSLALVPDTFMRHLDLSECGLGAKEIFASASVLDKTPAKFRAVRHIYANYSPLAGPSTSRIVPPSIYQTITTKLSRHLAADNYKSRHKQSSLSLANDVRGSLFRILTIVAPTLQTLALVVWPQLPFPAALPALEELSIMHPSAGGCLRSDSFDCINSVPSLRRPALTGFLRVINPLGVVDGTESFAPSLTHMCIPVEPINIRLTVYRIAAAMASAKMQSEADALVFPRTLEELLITASPHREPPDRIIANGNRRIICANKPVSRRLVSPGEMYLH